LEDASSNEGKGEKDVEGMERCGSCDRAEFVGSEGECGVTFVEGLGVGTGVSVGERCPVPGRGAGDFFRRLKRGILRFGLLEESVGGDGMEEC
jgi:hypothetical protein